MEIVIGVGGRFHADRMAQACLDLGHGIQLLTTLPRSRFSQFKSRRVRSYLWPEVIYRVGKRLGWEISADLYKMGRFSKWTRNLLETQEPPDVLVTWSSFGLEAFQQKKSKAQILVRDSAHIQCQMEILQREYEKLGRHFKGAEKIIERELKEYELADRITVLSEFAKASFLERGVPENKLHLLSLGVDLNVFQPKLEKTSEGPLKVVYFGALSVQKGVRYLLEATQRFSPNEVEWHLVGAVEPVLQPTLAKYSGVHFYPPMPHSTLSQFIRKMDVFVFPTVHDGFGQTLIQAMASGLVPIVTDHCGAADIIKEGTNGFRIPSASAEAIAEKLSFILTHRNQIPDWSQQAVQSASQMTWQSYSKQVDGLLQSLFR